MSIELLIVIKIAAAAALQILYGGVFHNKIFSKQDTKTFHAHPTKYQGEKRHRKFQPT
jgi:hypothetical protein